MAWDSSRPVPWRRLMREWVIYAAIMSVVFFVFFRDDGVTGALAGVLVSGPLYLGFGAVLAKFGYQRKSLKDLRTPQAEPRSSSTSSTSSKDDASRDGRPKPPPTRRTATGPNRPLRKPRR